LVSRGPIRNAFPGRPRGDPRTLLSRGRVRASILVRLDNANIGGSLDDVGAADAEIAAGELQSNLRISLVNVIERVAEV